MNTRDSLLRPTTFVDKLIDVLGVAKLDRSLARALVEAGYMDLKDYIDLFGEKLTHEEEAKAGSEPMR